MCVFMGRQSRERRVCWGANGGHGEEMWVENRNVDWIILIDIWNIIGDTAYQYKSIQHQLSYHYQGSSCPRLSASGATHRNTFTGFFPPPLLAGGICQSTVVSRWKPFFFKTFRLPSFSAKALALITRAFMQGSAHSSITVRKAAVMMPRRWCDGLRPTIYNIFF